MWKVEGMAAVGKMMWHYFAWGLVVVLELYIVEVGEDLMVHWSQRKLP